MRSHIHPHAADKLACQHSNLCAEQLDSKLAATNEYTDLQRQIQVHLTDMSKLQKTNKQTKKLQRYNFNAICNCRAAHLEG